MAVRVTQHGVIQKCRGTDAATGVARRGLHPQVAESAFAQNASIRQHVQGDATGEAEILGA